MPRYHSRAERAADLLQSRRSTVESVAKQTGLPVDIVRQINEPIAKRLAEQDAVDAAERSMRKAEAKIMREQYPCPLCSTVDFSPRLKPGEKSMQTKKNPFAFFPDGIREGVILPDSG